MGRATLTHRGPAFLVAFLLVGGCGGGGGDGDGGAGQDSPLRYSGSTTAAIVTTTNAAKLTADVLGGGDTAAALGTVGGVSVAHAARGVGGTGGIADIGRLVSRSMRRTPLKSALEDAKAAAIPLDLTEPCDSGSVRVSGTLADNGTGTVSASYNSCTVNGDTLNGAATIRIDAFNLALAMPIDFTVTFPRMTFLAAGFAGDVGGTFRSQTSLPTNSETVVLNIVALDRASGRMTMTQDLVIFSQYSNVLSPSSFSESITGRSFDSIDGFVDVATPQPLYFGTATQEFPEGGQAVLTGAGAAAIRVTPVSPTSLVLGLDLDGNGTAEQTAQLKWTDLSGPVGADLGDTDGDGMHNGWEAALGLDPADPADAGADKDGDGASNKQEYLAGTDPNSGASMPPQVGLSLAIMDSPDPVVVGQQLTYTISVLNSSASAAAGVVVTDVLPSGVNLVSASAGCTGTTTLSCAVGTVSAFAGFGFTPPTITLVVMPTAEGLITNTAAVTSSSFDPDPSNNNASSTTTVGQPAAGIQGLIDAAAPGAVVNVPPGIYAGGLDFKGKAITLQSTSGPASTFINGGSGTAVQMGPGGVLRGFTIAGAQGVAVSGSGSLITGNVFEGTMSEAVYGNNASPIVERNLIRNVTCGDSSISGTIVFVNVSSPVIDNNVFASNQCRGVNLTLPTGNTPQVINNTFIGNAAAIRVDRRVPQGTQIYRNNLLVQNGIGLEVEFGTEADNPLWENNVVFGNTMDYQGTSSKTGVNGNISADPLFVDAAAGDYHLQSGSPAVDAGSATGAPSIDYEGAARPADGNGDGSALVDIGAFERQ